MAKKTSGSRSKKSKSGPLAKADEVLPETVEDAEIVAESTSEEITATVEEPAEDVVEDTREPATDSVTEDVVDPVPEPELEPEIVEESVQPESHPEPVEAAPAKQNTFIPLVLGGLVAGIIGYGIATLQGGDDTTALESTIASQSDEISTLRADITTLAERPDASGLSEQVAGIEASVADRSAAVDSSIAALDERMTAVEKQPSADGTLQEAAIAAYERDIAELRDQIAAQQEEMRELLSETREEAQAIEENAIASARNATARASLAIVQGALETGSPMGAALNDLDGATADPVPDALMAAKDGIETLAVLQDDFPEAARAALATARSEGAAGEDTGTFSGFLRSQLNVRSVEPQEGDGADAVLSRAEAALRDGRLNDTLAELASLPEVARGDLSEWTARAEQRAAALDAAATLASQLNVN